MKTPQLLQLIISNRELIQRNNTHAIEHLQMLKNDYAHITDEEVILNLELNNSLSEYHFHSLHSKAIENSLQVVSKYKNSIHKNVIARHYWLIGECYANTGEYEQAKKYLLLSLLNIDSDQPAFTTTKTDTLIALAMNEEMAEMDHQKSIQYLEEALDLLQETGLEIRKAGCLMGLGNVHINTGDTEEALTYYNDAAETYEQFFDLANMASAYSNIGTCYIEMKDYANAEKFLQRSLDLRIKFGSPEHISVSYFNLALLNKETSKLDAANDYLLKCKEILLQTGNNLHLKDTEELLKEICDLRQNVLV